MLRLVQAVVHKGLIDLTARVLLLKPVIEAADHEPGSSPYIILIFRELSLYIQILTKIFWRP